MRSADGVHRFKKQSAEQLVAMTGAIITSLTKNPAFPAPTVDLKAVQAHGGTAATAEKNNKPGALIAVLRKLKQ